jgi:aminopeptidase YwaD
MPRTLRSVLLVLLAVSAVRAGAQTGQGVSIPALKAHTSYLASDALQGRATGTAGNDSAAAYVHDRLAALGLTLLYDNGYQSFDVTTGLAVGPKSALTVAGRAWSAGADFIPLGFSADARVDARVVFAGHGIEVKGDSLSWHDYEGLEVKDAWVMLLRGAPDDKNSMFDAGSGMLAKALAAKDRGAAGVLLVAGPSVSKDDVPATLDMRSGDNSIGIPVLSIRRAVADALLAGKGTTLAKEEAGIAERHAPHSFDCGVSASGEAQVTRITARTRNVAAMLPGSDPRVKDQVVIVGAHFDHLGMGGPGSGSRRPDTLAVHNGADDNASGTAAVLEIARVLAALPERPRRSIVFAGFTGEEMGVLGSKQFANKPPVDLARADLMVNLDMVGRYDTSKSGLSIGGVGTARGLERLVTEKAAAAGMKIVTSPEGYGPSDHASFYTKNVPVLFFFTGAHEDYHTPDDDADRLNYDGQKRVTDLATAVILAIADQDSTLAFQEAGPKEQADGRRNLKVTLGIMPDVSGSTDVKGLRADAVVKGKPAAAAGMLKGDVITAIEGKPVTGIYDYMARLGECKPGQRVTVEVLRNGEKVVLIVQL